MVLRYLLDTNICIYIAKHRPLCVLERFDRLEVGAVAMSLVTYGELLYGAEKSQHSKKSLGILEELATLIPPLPLSVDVGIHYARIRATLEKQGMPIGNNDLWISAHALALDTVLVTNNLKEFSRVQDLNLENWVEL